MSPLLFNDFLSNDVAFQDCERFWQGVLDELAASMGQSDRWVPWTPKTYGNGMPIDRDLRPILDAWRPDLRRGFRVLQGSGSDDLIGIAAWLGVSHAPDGDPSDELVISLVLTEHTLDIARRLLREWMSERATTEKLRRLISEIVPPTTSD